MRRNSFAVLTGIFFGLVACSSPKKKAELTFKDIEGKKVALVSIEAEPTAKKIIEVSLVNELIQNGSFILISKQELEKAKEDPTQDPMDWRGLARRAGADIALHARVLEFSAETHQGYSREQVIDSQLAQDLGTDGKTERLYKVKELTGQVRLELEWTQLDSDLSLKAQAQAQKSVTGEAKTGAIHLPPKMQFLATLTQEAIHQFFTKILK